MIRKAPLPPMKKVTEPVDIASVGRVSSPMQSSGPCMVTSYLDLATERSTQGFWFSLCLVRVSSTPQYARCLNAPCRLLPTMRSSQPG